MGAMTLTDSVAGDYLRDALSVDGGKLRHAGALAQALRGAFLIDFDRLGMLVERPEGSELDTSPTGSDSADDLLQELVEHPDRTMECWPQRGVPHIHEVIAELLADKVWTVERHGIGAMHVRYVDSDADRFAALAAALLAACGPLKPVVRDVVNFLHDSEQQAIAVGTVSTQTNAIGILSI